MTKQKKQLTHSAAAFWDTSAIVPLCCFQNASSKAKQLTQTFARQIVWWATAVEAISALQRLAREGHVSTQELAQAHARLAYLRSRWSEVQPSDILRKQAERLLRMHKLRAADALQLSAALTWCNSNPRDHTFVAGDLELLAAAQIEGFSIHQLR